MKKITLILSVVAVASLASCKKDRVCTCTSSSNAPATSGYTTSHTDEITMKKVSKGTAKRACVKTETTSNGSTYTTTNDCKLK